MKTLKDIFDYNPISGEIRWKVSRGPKRAGDFAGCIDSNGYRKLHYDGQSLYGHRIAWILSNGPIPPKMEIDHINGNRADNRLENLRVVSVSENQLNTHRSRSSLHGISWNNAMQKWKVVLTKNGKQHYFGYFINLSDAKAKAKAAKELLGFPQWELSNG